MKKEGLVVPPADEKSLASAMYILLTNPKERERYVFAAKEKVTQLSPEIIAAKYRDLLLGCLDES